MIGEESDPHPEVAWTLDGVSVGGGCGWGWGKGWGRKYLGRIFWGFGNFVIIVCNGEGVIIMNGL